MIPPCTGFNGAALGGARKALNEGAACDGRLCFNGAALGGARKGHGRTDYRGGFLPASMVPRSGERGRMQNAPPTPWILPSFNGAALGGARKVNPPARMAHRQDGFNGAALGEARKGIVTVGICRFCGWLQWCRARGSAEGPRPSPRDGPFAPASMVPRSGERGRQAESQGNYRGQVASMVPRSGERGRQSTFLSGRLSNRSFNGAALGGARKGGYAGAGVLLVVASMVPRSGERGRYGFKTEVLKFDKLQWCRARGSAEGARSLATLTAFTSLQWCRARGSAEGVPIVPLRPH